MSYGPHFAIWVPVTNLSRWLDLVSSRRFLHSSRAYGAERSRFKTHLVGICG
ncbi:Uncharacterized protein APZ42_005897 [Daphnia magna]|uniref:Uncharacterized protein n=1 Tax=Daphnia magna TaxID=35525 RepID=A0A164G708_9CRUS|nr:Uncharacterized protein APZ42_005897 [Daphnia magna]